MNAYDNFKSSIRVTKSSINLTSALPAVSSISFISAGAKLSGSHSSVITEMAAQGYIFYFGRS
jgi:hypothetical protein